MVAGPVILLFVIIIASPSLPVANDVAVTIPETYKLLPSNFKLSEPTGKFDAFL
jgi:hypothetical protein